MARLIHRTTRRLATTDVGQVFYDDVVAILAAAAAAEARVAGLTDLPSGRLHISAPTSFGRMHIAPYLKNFLDAYPGVALELDLSDGFVDLIESRMDLAIRIAAYIGRGIGRDVDRDVDSDVSGSLAAHRIAANRRVLCAAPAYLERHGTPKTLETLTSHRLLAATNQTPWRLEGKSHARTLPVESTVRTNSSEVVRELAISGYGIALRSTWDVGVELRSGALVQILPEWEGAADVAIFAVHPRNNLVPAHAKAFIGYLQTLYNPVAPWDSAA